MKVIIILFAACAFAQPPVDWDAVGDQINPYHPPHHCENGLGNDVNTPACQENQHDANTPEVSGFDSTLFGLFVIAAIREVRKRRK